MYTYIHCIIGWRKGAKHALKVGAACREYGFVRVYGLAIKYEMYITKFFACGLQKDRHVTFQRSA